MFVDLLSVRTFGVARVMMALCVFFCHVFEWFNYFGFLFVGVFFFMSGYGMEIGNRRKESLERLVPYIFLFAWFSLLYFFFYRVWVYPSGWFLVVYFVVMVMYRFLSNIYALAVAFLVFGVFMYFCGFENGWSASYGGFLFGVYFARNRSFYVLPFTMLLVPVSIMFFYRVEISLWFLIPLFSWLVFLVCSLPFLRFLSSLSRYTFYFYCVHCLILGLFGATWTLGGSPSVMGCIAAFLVSVGVSVFLKDSLFSYPKIQKAG